jgi:hypothetical protein
VRLQVTDDSGFLALVDPDAYSGFVGADWSLEEVLARFREQMAARRLLIWGTGQEGCWTVDVSVRGDAGAGVRDVFGSIVSSSGRLLLTNYESLTMAAQFPDVTLPERHQADLVLAVPSGPYLCRVVQHALSDGGWEEGCAPEFTVLLEPEAALRPPWVTIPWADSYL